LRRGDRIPIAPRTSPSCQGVPRYAGSLARRDDGGDGVHIILPIGKITAKNGIME
jgi:hypothetical protein